MGRLPETGVRATPTRDSPMQIPWTITVDGARAWHVHSCRPRDPINPRSTIWALRKSPGFDRREQRPVGLAGVEQ